MLTGPDDTNRLDRFAAALAGLTALHCVLAPWLPAALGDSASHAVLALSTAGVSVPACVRGWLEHHSLRVFGWALPSWLALGLARLGGGRQLGEVTEVLLTVAAASLLFMAHQLNRSLAYWRDKS